MRAWAGLFLAVIPSLSRDLGLAPSIRRWDQAEMFRLRRDAPPLKMTIGLSPGWAILDKGWTTNGACMQTTLRRVAAHLGLKRGWARRIADAPMLARRRIAALLPAAVLPIIPMVEDAPRVLGSPHAKLGE